MEVTVSFPTTLNVEVSFPVQTIGGECLPATYENSDQSYQVSIEGGETHIGPDITITSKSPGKDDDTDTDVPGYSDTSQANKNILIPNSTIYADSEKEVAVSRELKPGSILTGPKVLVTNSLESILLSKSSNPELNLDGSVTFPDISEEIADVDNVDSDGRVVPTPAGVPFIATACPTIEKKFMPVLPFDHRTSFGYSSQYAGDLYSLIASGWFDFWDYGASPIQLMQLGADPYTLSANSLNPWGNTDRYTTIDGLAPSANRTTWDISQFTHGDEYCPVDWLTGIHFYQPNVVVTDWESCLDQVAALNAMSFKGFSDWVMVPVKDIFYKVFYPDKYENYYQTDHNLSKRNLISSQYDTYAWTGEPDQTPTTTAWAVNDQGDCQRRNKTASTLHGLYICRKIQPGDYASFL
jgi:hypothetical protein